MTTAIATSSRRTAGSRTGTIALLVLRVALAVQFAGGGLAKLAGSPPMVDMFAEIGAGQGLRYLVGMLEIAGAAGLLVPRLVGPAAVGLAGLMVGATVTNVAVLDASPALPVVILLVAVLIAWSRRAQLRSLAGTFTR